MKPKENIIFRWVMSVFKGPGDVIRIADKKFKNKPSEEELDKDCEQLVTKVFENQYLHPSAVAGLSVYELKKTKRDAVISFSFSGTDKATFKRLSYSDGNRKVTKTKFQEGDLGRKAYNFVLQIKARLEQDYRKEFGKHKW
ncbi:MAG: hypothetical protein WCE90_04470 [Candidatus Zixiibacteriota bacterium]